MLIELWSCSSWLLLIERATGVRYTNQVGGYACRHPEIEGFCVPIENGSEVLPWLDEIASHFTGSKYGGWCCDGIDVETALFLEGLFGKIPSLEKFKVDRSRLRQSKEAWVYVIGRLSSGVREEPATEELRGVLTWENSD